MSDYDMSIHQNTDARAWARFFKQTCDKLGKECDEEWMVTWFANAMEAMRGSSTFDIEAFPPESELPDWEDLRGCAPDATGGQPSEVFVRELRDGWR